jgi:hypothetical protein
MTRVTEPVRRAALAPALAAVLVAALAGCAPIAAYRGAAPVPGAVTAFEPGGDARLAPGSTDAAHHRMGARAAAHGADSTVVLIYGDNRAGMRLQAHSRLMRAVKRMSFKHPIKLARGLAAIPVFLVVGIVPNLDIPRDIIAHWSKAPTGGAETSVLRALERQLPADLVVSNGDLVTDGRRGGLWRRFVDRHEALRARTLFVATPGNHERTADSLARANWDATMGAPAEPGRYWFALDLPDCDARIVVLDSNALRDTHRGAAADLAEAQLAWADSVLALPARWKFVVFHHPLISAGHYRNAWDSHRPEDPAAKRRERLLEMFVARGVTAAFTGHEHLYQRVFVRGANGGGFWHITAAGGGAPLYVLDPRIRDIELAKPLPPGIGIVPSSVFSKSVYNFCRLALPPAGAPDGALTMQAYRVRSGGRASPLDRIDLAHPPQAP